MSAAPKYQRILLKLSGEALMGSGDHGIDPATIAQVAGQVKEVVALGVQVGLVVGGGNIFRGLAGAAKGMDRVTGDHMGMLATVINSLALRDGLNRAGVPAHVLTAIDMELVAERFTRRAALAHFDKGHVVICAGGTGNPYFTTDTTACLRALEIDATVVMKATKVDGIYTADPEKDPTAKKLDHLSYMDVVQQQLKVMDTTAITLCMDNRLPIMVFNMTAPGNIVRAVMGEPIGTVVEDS